MTIVFEYPGCLNLNPARLKTQYKLNIFDPKTPAWVLSSFVSVNGGSSRHRVTKPPVCSVLSGVYFFNIKGADCIHSTRRVFLQLINGESERVKPHYSCNAITPYVSHLCRIVFPLLQ